MHFSRAILPTVLSCLILATNGALGVGSGNAVLEGVPAARSTVTGRDFLVLPALSPSSRAAVLFLDDGAFAYFYALDLERPLQPIVDSLFVYDKRQSDVDDRKDIRILWSSDGSAAALILNDRAEAVFNFVQRRGFGRSGMPAAAVQWTSSHEWDDEAALLPFLNSGQRSHRE